MRIGIPIWNGRVSPVLDVACRLLVVDVQGGAEIRRRMANLGVQHVSARARRIHGLGVDELICGAVSKPLEAALLSVGVRIVPLTCGSIEDILRAFLAGRVTEDRFRMPGCCTQRRRARLRRGQN